MNACILKVPSETKTASCQVILPQFTRTACALIFLHTTFIIVVTPGRIFCLVFIHVSKWKMYQQAESALVVTIVVYQPQI